LKKAYNNNNYIINAFRPALTNVNDEEKIPLYKKMMLISMKENEFAAKALNFKQFISKKRKKFDHLTIAFPILTEEYIKYLTFGIYQLKQALSYTYKHLDENGNYIFELNCITKKNIYTHVQLYLDQHEVIFNF